MHSCKQVEKILETYLAGELLPSDQQILDQHLSSCLDCQALMSLHEELICMNDNVAEPSPEAFQNMRSRLLWQISRQSSDKQQTRTSRKIPAFIPSLAAAASMLLGVFLGSWLTTPVSVDDQLLDAITRQASIEGSLEDSWDAPLFFSNVSVRHWNDKRVSMGFDVCRSVDLTTGLNSPLTSDILTHAILSSDSVGGRMRAMEIAAMSTEQRLTSALIVALHQDPDQTMRIAALNALAQKDNSDQIQLALLSTLRDDNSVQVRILALEHLAGQALGQEVIETVIRQGDKDSNPAVFQRARELKTDLSAEGWL